MNNGKINFAGCTEYGKALDDDLVIDGDYYLAAGVLEIGDNEFTVNGNLIQGGGTIKLGTGTLTVKGDYRIQSRTEKENVAEGETEKYNYGSSTGSLEMTSAECSVIVKDNFITQSMVSHRGKLTAGTMKVGGNFEQISSNANSENFVSTENHTVQFNGKNVTHEINLGGSSSYFNILDITNTTINLKSNNVYVHKELKGETGKIIGNCIYLQDAKLPGIIDGNVYIYGCTLNSDIHIKGNLSVGSRYYYDNETFNLNGNKLTVDGDFNSSKTYIYFNKGEIICNSNCAIGSSSILYQKNAEDKLTVSGNFTYSGYGSSDNMVDGTITIGGNCTIASDNFKPCGEHTIVFNGTKEVQTIKVNSSSSFFNKVVFSGSDKIFGTTCEINSFEKDPKCNVTFYGNGKSGWKLEGNETIEGDLYLVNGELDLGKYDLTITGNLIQGGGTIKLGTGTLTVNKDYRIQSRTEKENVAEGETEKYNYGSSTGSLEMTSVECSLIVKGNFITQSAINHNGKLTAGTMEIGGNFEQIGSYSNNFYATESHKVILFGKDNQDIKFQAPSYSRFCHLEINNDSSVNFQTDVYINGKIYEHLGKVLGSGWLYVSSLEQIDGYHFSGKVSVNNNNSNQTLEQDLTVGSITANYLHINGNVLTADNITVNKGLYVEGGTVNCKNNINFNNESYFTMNVENSYVLVGGNFYNYSYRCSSWELTEGILDIKGDFTQTQNSQFVCKDNHITVLTSKKLPGGRDYTQTIKFSVPGESKFNILRITKPKSKYVVLDSSNKQASFDLIYNKLEENYTDEIPPTKVKDLEVSDIGSTSAKLSWSPSADNYGVMGYEIHRNGEKIQLTGKTAYTDNHLMPETKYEYTVYAIDESWNYSEISDSVTITTGKDTESPSTPKNLKISSRTGSSITITWSASSDNVGVAGYKIFRGTDEIADITGKTSYKDTKLEADRQYTYQVKAYDAAGNLSSFCDSVSGCPVMPVIKRITPADASIIGGKTKELQVIFADNGNSTDNKVKFEYKKSGNDKFTPIVDELVDQEKYSSDSLCAKCIWNIYGLENSYIVRITVYDADGNFSSKEVEYTLDSAPPLLPKDFVAKTDNGVVSLSWSSSISKNCIGYNIYRSNSVNGEYTYLFTVTGSGTEMYQDRSVNSGETYFYKIESIGSYDINSKMSEYVSVTVDEDKMPPTISGILPSDSRINKITKITVEANDNISVETIEFYYKSKGSEEWHDLEKVSVKNGKASINFVTTDLADGEYTIKAIAQDANKNKSDAATKDFTVDNTGISKIIIDEENCTANSSFVSIRWEDAVESDFGWFAVEKKIGENNFKEVGTTSQITGMHVENLQPNTAYTFRVVGYDNLGNIGEYSDEITLITTSDTVKPGISAFRPSSSSFSDKINISITGVDNIGINSLKLRYSYDSAEEKTWIDLKEIIAEKKNASETFEYIFDISKMPEGEVYVEAEVIDTSGNPGEVCINKFRIDRTAPNAITDLKADGGSGNVHLTWSVSDNDIKSFEIFRCEGEKSDFSKIADCTTKDYYDTNVTFNTFYTYKIVAVDTAGNKSQASNYAVTQAEEDTVAPKVYGFSYSSGTVLPSNPKIAVVASDNFKLDHVEISYKKADDPNNIWHDIKSIKMDSSYQSKEFDWVTDGFEEDKYILKAVAYDANGLSSDSFTAEFTFDFTAPQKPNVIKLRK